ncbi:MAG: hypothetical protein IRZ33_00360 [Alicyclobacillaceae bacterium]|nr:hypothetical protein [Alicyclobacillaceae bacterium]
MRQDHLSWDELWAAWDHQRGGDGDRARLHPLFRHLEQCPECASRYQLVQSAHHAIVESLGGLSGLPQEGGNGPGSAQPVAARQAPRRRRTVSPTTWRWGVGCAAAAALTAAVWQVGGLTRQQSLSASVRPLTAPSGSAGTGGSIGSRAAGNGPLQRSDARERQPAGAPAAVQERAGLFSTAAEPPPKANSLPASSPPSAAGNGVAGIASDSDVQQQRDGVNEKSAAVTGLGVANRAGQTQSAEPGGVELTVFGFRPAAQLRARASVSRAATAIAPLEGVRVTVVSAGTVVWSGETAADGSLHSVLSSTVPRPGTTRTGNPSSRLVDSTLAETATVVFWKTGFQPVVWLDVPWMRKTEGQGLHQSVLMMSMPDGQAKTATWWALPPSVPLDGRPGQP